MSRPVQVTRSHDKTVDGATVAAAIAGDDNAFATIYTTYQQVVRRIVSNRMRDHCVATIEDIVADTFAKAWENIARYQHRDTDIGAWIGTIAVNLVRDYRKSAPRRVVPCGEMVTINADPAPSPEDTVIEKDTSHRLSIHMRTCIATLTPKQRLCLHLRYARHASLSETAQKLGMSVTAVKALQYRAQRSLQRLLAPSTNPAKPEPDSKNQRDGIPGAGFTGDASMRGLR